MKRSSIASAFSLFALLCCGGVAQVRCFYRDSTTYLIIKIPFFKANNYEQDIQTLVLEQ